MFPLFPCESSSQQQTQFAICVNQIFIYILYYIYLSIGNQLSSPICCRVPLKGQWLHLMGNILYSTYILYILYMKVVGEELTSGSDVLSCQGLFCQYLYICLIFASGVDIIILMYLYYNCSHITVKLNNFLLIIYFFRGHHKI